ncbi:MAG: aminopeptidase [Acidobacteria bacterium]|nr:MAG: aminopeptidase [Acidobacteriota bacterium]
MSHCTSSPRGRGQAAASVLLVLLIAASQTGATPPAPLAHETKAVLRRISANSLRGHLSFIASDLLEGRGTPSRGLDLAAEYIAAQFRRAGLEPVGDDGYYQTAAMLEIGPKGNGFEMTIEDGRRRISIAHQQITPRFHNALQISGAAIYKVDPADEAAMEKLKPEDVDDKVVVTAAPDFSGLADASKFREFRTLLRTLKRVNPKLTLMLTLDGLEELSTRLVSPEGEHSSGSMIVVRSPEALKWYESLRNGATEATTLTLHLSEPAEDSIKLRNVIGLLRGSDAALANTYVLVTAHYDHLGMKPEGPGDRIYNGANDDGSGTVSVIEIANALASLQPRPRRSIVFMTFFGEEEGTLGSLYYSRHPAFPIAKTVADVNLEQVGRTDATDGPKISQATFTGYDYSDLPRVFRLAGALTGVRVLSDRPYGDSFFVRSDNAPLASQGVPAHTLAVAFDFPDYHKVTDDWRKIDYDNMAKVDRMVALGVMMVADNPQPPRWNEADAKTEPYVKAWKEHHKQ